MGEFNNQYEAGLCNIGKHEISIRKKLFSFSLLVCIAMACLSICFYQHRWMQFLLFSSTFFTILLFIEIRIRFCILFGLFNLYNFNKLGQLDNVTFEEHRKKDKLKAFKIITLTTLAATLITIAEYKMMIYLNL